MYTQRRVQLRESRVRAASALSIGLALGGSLVVTSACRKEPVASSDIANAVPVVAEVGVQLVVETDQSKYESQEPVTIALRATNTTGASVTFAYRSAQEFDVVVTKEDMEIWRWSDGRAFGLLMPYHVLAPGEDLLYETMWPQQDEQGRVVASGTYKIHGLLATDPEIVSDPIVVQLER